jgi:beta-lactamase regulating signal transducer with metallopeptidase domain/tetratricopeptide (TPR) repeat protein
MILLNFFARALAFHVLLIPVITLLGALVLLTLVKLKKAPAALRTGISGATLMVVLILPWAATMVPKVTIPIFSAVPDAQTESLDRHLPPPGVILPPLDSSQAPAPRSEFTSSSELSKAIPTIKSPSHRLNWRVLFAVVVLALVCAWILGVAWGFVFLMLGMVGIIRLRWSSHLVTDTRLIEALRSSCERLNYRGSVLFLVSDQIALPITWGLLRAKIALPKDALNWPAERIDAALLHELAHIKRHDFAIQTLSRFACVFHWYNPLVLGLFRAWKSDAEQACDDLVLRSGYSGERYSDILLEVWRSATIPRPQSSLGLAMVRSSTLEQRVVAILDPEREREEVSPRKQKQLLALFGGITILIAIISLTRPTNYHLTPELQNDMQAILRQVQTQEGTHLSLQLGLERQQEYWSSAKGAFEPQPEPTVADITLELAGAEVRYRAHYHPSVNRWIHGSAPFYIESKTDVSDGESTWTILAEHHDNSKWRGGGGIGFLAGFGYRADDQVRTVINGLEGNGFTPFNGASYGIERTVLNGAPAVRVQDIFTTVVDAQRRTWWFDPRRDYALIQYELADFNSGSAQPTYSEVTSVQQLQKLADGVWYPTHFSTQSSRYADGQLTDDSFRSSTKITSLVALPSISPATFLATSVAVDSPAQIPPEPTAQEIYDAMFQRYAKCSTFACTGLYEQHSDGLFGTKDHRTFSIRYARPDKIRIEWTQPSRWWSNSGTSTIYTEGGKIFSKLNFRPTIESDKSIGDAISEAAGVSGTTSYLLPPLLMGKSGYFDHWNLERKPDETVAGDDCYVIELETKGFGYYTLDVRKTDHAIVRAVDVFKADVVDAQRTRANKENPAWFNDSGGPMKTMVSDTATTEFKNIFFDQPLKDEDFLLNASSTLTVVPAPQANETLPVTQNSQLQGRVLDANGGPVGNAKISLVQAGRLMTITDGQIDSGTESILSASDGGFTLNQSGVTGDLLVAVNEDGYAVIPWKKFSGTVTLTTWASVSGTVSGESMPTAQKSVEFQVSIPLNPRSPTEGQVRLLSRATVDSQGSFLASHVPVGVVNAMLAAGPLSDQHALLDQHSLMETIHIETQANQTARADFGGKGITVTGKAEMPNDPDLDLNWGQIFWARSPVGLNIPSGMLQEQADKLTREYYASDAGKKALLATRIQYFHIHADGSFKIENVSPGSYELRIDFIHKPTESGRNWSVGNTSASVEVKAGDTSVDVPLLKLHLLPKPPVSTTSNDARNPSLPASLQMEGEKLTIDEIAGLEKKVASDPSDLPDRVRILGYYFIKRISEPSAQNAAQPYILWIIRNFPAIAGDPIASVDYRTDLPHYEEASEAWKEALAKYPNDSKVIGNAAAFYLLNEPQRAEKLLLQGEKLEPNNTAWAMRLGQLYTLRSMGPDTSVKTASKAEALKWFEQGLSSLKGIDRFYALEAPAKAAFEAGDFATAHQYAQELLQMAPQYPKDWNYGNALYTGNSVLGQIALAQGDIPSAKNYLAAAGDSPGSPQLNSFGPDLTLARQLLEKGEKDAVIAFLGKIAKFWKGHEVTIQDWQKAIRQGQTTF